MGKSVTQKILEAHLVEGTFEPGKEVAIKIDQTLTQDATGTMAYLQFEVMGQPKVRTELSVRYIDHNTIQVGFENADDAFARRATENKNSGKHNIIVAGLSYGQGSSREHAALCPMFLGVKAVLAKSFERIHSANLINFGIVPLTFKTETDYDKIDSEDEIRIPDIKKAIANNEPLTVKNLTKKTEFQVNYELTERQRNIILAGGMLSYIKNKL